MIVLPDGKICRNLPEQVAENLKKIQEIIHFLDGVNIQDNLVVVADLSQILTEAELDVVERPVAFIYYNSELYIKKNETAGVAYFVNVFSIEDTGTQLNFNSNEMQVNLGTGALTYTTATASSYTKSQINSLLALKANDNEVAKLTGANFTGAITGPSIIENMSGYSFTAGTAPAGVSYSFLYKGAVKTGNKLTLACAVKINSTSAIAGLTAFNIGDFIVPLEVANKLFGEDIGSSTNVLGATSAVSFYAGSVSFTNAYAVYLKRDTTHVRCLAYPNNTLAANTDYILRFDITFLLSDPL